MARKFMVVKAKKCCGYSEGIGAVLTHVPRSLAETVECIRCGKITSSKGYIPYINPEGKSVVIEESRIIWLPDEQDIITHDMLKEITA